MEAQGSEAVVEAQAPRRRTPEGWHQYWQREKAAAEKRLAPYLKSGNDVVRRFLDVRTGDLDASGMSRLNLLHTNVSTVMAMLCGNTPKVDVSREHQDPDDDIARVAAYLYQRILETDKSLTPILKQTLQDRLLPGAGIARVLYDYKTQTVQKITGEKVEYVSYENAGLAYVHWQDFLWGWARTWDELPWMGFRVWLDKDAATERFGAKKAEKLSYKAQMPTGSDKTDPSGNADQKSNTHKAEIWEFWHKAERTAFWYSEGADMILDAVEDPLGLDNFWPAPRPMMANLTTTLLEPRADFVIGQDLYNEIDILQTRIARITEAIKVVGVYDQSAGASVGRMLKEGTENSLIPVDNWAMFAEKGGLKGTIDWFPVDTIVGVLQTLAQVQENKISQLYDLTGISTLLRGGDTQQYTSDGTNKLTAKFGSIRIQALQDEFARFASDLEALRTEVISKHFMPESIIRQSNAYFMPEPDKQYLAPALQLMKSADVQWRVDIKPESIAMVDYAQLKNERVEYLTAMSTFIQSAQAMVKQLPQSTPVLLEFMKYGLAGFKGSDYLEGILDQAIEMAQKAPPQGGDDSGKDMAIEQMRHQNKMQENQQKGQLDMQREQQKSQNAMALENQDQKNKMELEQTAFRNTMMEMMREQQHEMRKLFADLQANLQVEQAQSEFAIAERNVEHAHNMTEIEENAKVAASNQRAGEE